MATNNLALGGAYFILLNFWILSPAVNEILFGSLTFSILLGFFLVLYIKKLSLSSHKAFWILFGFTLIIYSLGLLPITSRRDYLDIEYWSFNLILALFSLSLGYYLAHKIQKLKSGSKREFSVLRGYVVLTISLLASIYITVAHGFLIINPENRFQVSSVYLYFIELSLVFGIALFAKNIIEDQVTIKTLTLIVLVIFLLLSTGYRNQATIFLLGLGLIYFFSRKNTLNVNNELWAFIGIVVGLLFLSLLYYLRIQGSTETILSWNDRIYEFDILLPNFLIPILPLHEYSREIMGVAQISLERIAQIENYVSSFSLFFLDFTTIHPDYSLTATNVLGRVVANSDAFNLVPGSIGALLISFGYIGVIVVYVGLGYWLGLLNRQLTNSDSSFVMASMVLLVIYIFQFTLRGIPKPMYLLVIITLLFLYPSKKR